MFLTMLGNICDNYGVWIMDIKNKTDCVIQGDVMNKFMGIFGSKKAKFRLGIALLICFGQFNMGYLYLIYVIITESFKYRKNRRILRNQKKQNR